jgi:hypothetical protein
MSPGFMMPSTSSDLSSWISQSHIESDPLPALIDPSTNPEYRRQRDNCFEIFDRFSEDEQVFETTQTISVTIGRFVCCRHQN